MIPLRLAVGFTKMVIHHLFVAEKIMQEATPGIHYGNVPKLWDEHQTIIG